MELNRLLRAAYTYIIPLTPRNYIEEALKGPFPRVYRKKNFIFIHIPKTAGKSICQLIGVSGARHLTLNEYERHLDRATLEHFFIFTVVRHPIDRLESAWNYMNTGGNHSKEDLDFRKRWIQPFRTLDRFILQALKAEEVASLGKFRPQVDFLKWQDGQLASNITICHFENLEHDLSQLPKRILVSGSLPHVNASKRFIEKISDPARQRVARFYREDFEVLGYNPT
jgi:hypothetical protein